MGRLKDLSGEIFGRLKVLERSENIGKEVTWLCECQCDEKTKVIVKSRYLVNGIKKSCGCIREEIDDLTGLKFNHWKVMSYVGKNQSRNSLWICECDCDGKSTSIVSDNNLKTGKSKSCGCQNTRNKKHDKSRNGDSLDLKIYKAWSNMKERCYNKNNADYDIYGRRGIAICEEWMDDDYGFISFYNWSKLNGVEHGLSIDRIDVNGGYSPENCRWTDYKVQNNNRRNNKLISYKGKTQTLSLWADELNIASATLNERLKRGWEIDEAFSKSINKI